MQQLTSFFPNLPRHGKDAAPLHKDATQLPSSAANAEHAAALNQQAPPPTGQQSKDGDGKLDLWLEAYDAVSQSVVERACGKSLTIRVTTPGKKALRSVAEHYAERWRAGQGTADSQQQQVHPPLQIVFHATSADGSTHAFGPVINKRLKVSDLPPMLGHPARIVLRYQILLMYPNAMPAAQPAPQQPQVAQAAQLQPPPPPQQQLLLLPAQGPQAGAAGMQGTGSHSLQREGPQQAAAGGGSLQPGQGVSLAAGGPHVPSQGGQYITPVRHTLPHEQQHSMNTDFFAAAAAAAAAAALDTSPGVEGDAHAQPQHQQLQAPVNTNAVHQQAAQHAPPQAAGAMLDAQQGAGTAGAPDAAPSSEDSPPSGNIVPHFLHQQQQQLPHGLEARQQSLAQGLTTPVDASHLHMTSGTGGQGYSTVLRALDRVALETGGRSRPAAAPWSSAARHTPDHQMAGGQVAHGQQLEHAQQMQGLNSGGMPGTGGQPQPVRPPATIACALHPTSFVAGGQQGHQGRTEQAARGGAQQGTHRESEQHPMEHDARPAPAGPPGPAGVPLSGDIRDGHSQHSALGQQGRVLPTTARVPPEVPAAVHGTPQGSTMACEGRQEEDMNTQGPPESGMGPGGMPRAAAGAGRWAEKDSRNHNNSNHNQPLVGYSDRGATAGQRTLASEGADDRSRDTRHTDSLPPSMQAESHCGSRAFKHPGVAREGSGPQHSNSMLLEPPASNGNATAYARQHTMSLPGALSPGETQAPTAVSLQGQPEGTATGAGVGGGQGGQHVRGQAGRDAMHEDSDDDGDDDDNESGGLDMSTDEEEGDDDAGEAAGEGGADGEWQHGTQDQQLVVAASHDRPGAQLAPGMHPPAKLRLLAAGGIAGGVASGSGAAARAHLLPDHHQHVPQALGVAGSGAAPTAAATASDSGPQVLTTLQLLQRSHELQRQQRLTRAQQHNQQLPHAPGPRPASATPHLLLPGSPPQHATTLAARAAALAAARAAPSPNTPGTPAAGSAYLQSPGGPGSSGGMMARGTQLVREGWRRHPSAASPLTPAKRSFSPSHPKPACAKNLDSMVDAAAGSIASGSTTHISGTPPEAGNSAGCVSAGIRGYKVLARRVNHYGLPPSHPLNPLSLPHPEALLPKRLMLHAAGVQQQAVLPPAAAPQEQAPQEEGHTDVVRDMDHDEGFVAGTQPSMSMAVQCSMEEGAEGDDVQQGEQTDVQTELHATEEQDEEGVEQGDDKEDDDDEEGEEEKEESEEQEEQMPDAVQAAGQAGHASMLVAAQQQQQASLPPQVSHDEQQPLQTLESQHHQQQQQHQTLLDPQVSYDNQQKSLDSRHAGSQKAGQQLPHPQQHGEGMQHYHSQQAQPGVLTQQHSHSADASGNGQGLKQPQHQPVLVTQQRVQDSLQQQQQQRTARAAGLQGASQVPQLQQQGGLVKQLQQQGQQVQPALPRYRGSHNTAVEPSCQALHQQQELHQQQTLAPQPLPQQQELGSGQQQQHAPLQQGAPQAPPSQHNELPQQQHHPQQPQPQVQPTQLRHPGQQRAALDADCQGLQRQQRPAHQQQHRGLQDAAPPAAAEHHALSGAAAVGKQQVQPQSVPTYPTQQLNQQHTRPQNQAHPAPTPSALGPALQQAESTQQEGPAQEGLPAKDPGCPPPPCTASQPAPLPKAAVKPASPQGPGHQGPCAPQQQPAPPHATELLPSDRVRGAGSGAQQPPPPALPPPPPQAQPPSAPPQYHELPKAQQAPQQVLVTAPAEQREATAVPQQGPEPVPQPVAVTRKAPGSTKPAEPVQQALPAEAPKGRSSLRGGCHPLMRITKTANPAAGQQAQQEAAAVMPPPPVPGVHTAAVLQATQGAHFATQQEQQVPGGNNPAEQQAVAVPPTGQRKGCRQRRAAKPGPPQAPTDNQQQEQGTGLGQGQAQDSAAAAPSRKRAPKTKKLSEQERREAQAAAHAEAQQQQGQEHQGATSAGAQPAPAPATGLGAAGQLVLPTPALEQPAVPAVEASAGSGGGRKRSHNGMPAGGAGHASGHQHGHQAPGVGAPLPAELPAAKVPRLASTTGQGSGRQDAGQVGVPAVYAAQEQGTWQGAPAPAGSQGTALVHNTAPPPLLPPPHPHPGGADAGPLLPGFRVSGAAVAAGRRSITAQRHGATARPGNNGTQTSAAAAPPPASDGLAAAAEHLHGGGAAAVAQPQLAGQRIAGMAHQHVHAEALVFTMNGDSWLVPPDATRDPFASLLGLASLPPAAAALRVHDPHANAGINGQVPGGGHKPPLHANPGDQPANNAAAGGVLRSTVAQAQQPLHQADNSNGQLSGATSLGGPTDFTGIISRTSSHKLGGGQGGGGADEHLASKRNASTADQHHQQAAGQTAPGRAAAQPVAGAGGYNGAGGHLQLSRLLEDISLHSPPDAIPQGAWQPQGVPGASGPPAMATQHAQGAGAIGTTANAEGPAGGTQGTTGATLSGAQAAVAGGATEAADAQAKKGKGKGKGGGGKGKGSGKGRSKGQKADTAPAEGAGSGSLPLQVSPAAMTATGTAPAAAAPPRVSTGNQQPQAAAAGGHTTQPAGKQSGNTSTGGVRRTGQGLSQRARALQEAAALAAANLASAAAAIAGARGGNDPPASLPAGGGVAPQQQLPEAVHHVTSDTPAVPAGNATEQPAQQTASIPAAQHHQQVAPSVPSMPPPATTPAPAPGLVPAASGPGRSAPAAGSALGHNNSILGHMHPGSLSPDPLVLPGHGGTAIGNTIAVPHAPLGLGPFDEQLVSGLGAYPGDDDLLGDDGLHSMFGNCNSLFGTPRAGLPATQQHDLHHLQPHMPQQAGVLAGQMQQAPTAPVQLMLTEHQQQLTERLLALQQQQQQPQQSKRSGNRGTAARR